MKKNDIQLYEIIYFADKFKPVIKKAIVELDGRGFCFCTFPRPCSPYTNMPYIKYNKDIPVLICRALMFIHLYLTPQLSIKLYFICMHKIFSCTIQEICFHA